MTIATTTLDHKDYLQEVNKNLAKNLDYLLKAKGFTQNSFVAAMEDRGVRWQQGTLSNIIRHPEKSHLSIAVVKMASIILGVSIDTLFLEHEKLIAQRQEDTPYRHATLSFVSDYYGGEPFVIDVKNRIFKGVLGKYYCYFKPTISIQKEEGPILCELEIVNNEGIPYVEFALHTNRVHELGEEHENNAPETEYVKSYTGYLVNSPSLNCFYCALKGTNIDELCFLVFGTIPLNGKKLDCAIAEVLTVSAGTAKVPTSHRMLISREKISPEHYDLFMPLLLMNDSTINVEKKKLDAFQKNASEKERMVIDDLVSKKAHQKEMYIFPELQVTANGMTYEMRREEISVLVAKLRAISNAHRYNKVSKTADSHIHNALASVGYYEHRIIEIQV